MEEERPKAIKEILEKGYDPISSFYEKHRWDDDFEFIAWLNE